MENYVKERVLGGGSFGTVYQVRHRLVDDKLILKELTIHDDLQLQHTQIECQLLAQLNHDNIIQYFDSFQSSSGNLCLVMEYCNGAELNSKIRRRRGVPFNESLIVKWFHQLCSAIHYLHQKKILHRNIKTGNIFVTPDDTMVKLGDFGVAKTTKSNTIGTCASSETCKNHQYNFKSDIWALGCVVYQLVTLRPPFSGLNIHQVLTPISARYSYELRHTIALMLKKTGQQRPSAELLLKRCLFRACASKNLRLNPKTSKLQDIEKASGKEQRKKWNPPTQTLLRELSSLRLTDKASSIDFKRPSSCASSVSLHSDETYILLNKAVAGEDASSPFHESERNKMYLEMICGAERLKEGNILSHSKYYHY